MIAAVIATVSTAGISPQIGALVGAVFTAALAFLGTMLNSRTNKKAADVASAIEGFDKLAERLQNEISDLRGEVAELRKGLVHERSETKRLHAVIGVAVAHISKLYRIVRDNYPNVTLPPLPEALTSLFEEDQT